MLKKVLTLKPYCHFFLRQEKETGSSLSSSQGEGKRVPPGAAG